MRRLVLAAALSVTLVPQAFAWNAMGHMMVAAVAYEQLTPAARAHANRLLQLNPAYKVWAAGRRGAQRDELIFMQAATWADTLKPGAGAGEGYADTSAHHEWHLYSAPITLDRRATPGAAPTPNVATQIALFRKALQSDASDEVKSFDLVWLLNLAGDAHDPMQTATRVTRNVPDDQNGRLVSVCKKPCRNNLHDYWENILGVAKKPEAALEAAHSLPKAFAKLSLIDDENVWAQDSTHLAQTVAYAPPVGNSVGPYVLDPDYHDAALPVAKQQIALAGTRLAHLLNAQLVN